MSSADKIAFLKAERDVLLRDLKAQQEVIELLQTNLSEAHKRIELLLMSDGSFMQILPAPNSNKH